MPRLWGSALLGLLLWPLAANAESPSLLARIAAVRYRVELPDRSVRSCAGDLREVMTTVKFYGSQSRLRWYDGREAPARDAARTMPVFRIAIYPASGRGGCTAFVHVGLSAPLAGARIADSGLPFSGSAELWDKYYYLKGGAETFAVQIRDVAERAVKDFVADWSDANP